MKYISTRNTNLCATSAQAMKQGLAPDGGLYLPDTFPKISMEQLGDLCKADYPHRAANILHLYLSNYLIVCSFQYGDRFRKLFSS